MRAHPSLCFTGLLLAVAAYAFATPSLAQDKSAKPATATPETTGSTKSDSSWTGKVNEAGTAELVLSPPQVEAVKKISDYFNQLTNLKGIFVQTDPDKTRSRGKFYVKRPGKFRFDYGPPTRKVMASDGRFLRIREPHQDAGDTIELDNTPFRLLLKSDVNLLRDARILDVQEAEDMIVLALQDKNPDAPGRVRLYFSKKPEFDLKEWVVLDAQGLETRVEVTNLTKSEEINSKIFIWEHKVFQDNR